MSEDLKKIGQGTFGDVYLHTKTNRVHKYSKLFKENLVIIDNTLREAAFYKNIQNTKRNLLQNQPLDATLERFAYPPSSIPSCSVTTSEQYQNNRLLFIMDYAGVTLTKTSFVSKQITLQIFTQVCEALVWLHKNNMSHGDIKPSNIVVQPNNKTTLIDYGSLFFTSHLPIQNQRCTTYYISPEELATKLPTPSNDIWSFGVSLFEHITGESFLPNLLQFLGVSRKKIATFIHGCKQETESFQPDIFLTKFYHSIQYSNMLSFLQKKIKDRELLSIITNCLLFDTNIRIKAPTLYTMLLTLQSLPFPKTNNFLPMSLSKMPCKSYKVAKQHAGITAETRETIIDYISSLSETKNGPYYVAHTVMLLDRLLFRNFPNDLQFSLDLQIATCWCLSAAILQGSFLTFDIINQLSNGTHCNDSIKQCVLQTLHILDYKTFNASPDLITNCSYSLEWIHSFCSLAYTFPLLHTSLHSFLE
jgi:serine/threonine protein kinase